MYFAICSSDSIAYHSSAHACAVLSPSCSDDAVGMSVESLVTAALETREYTRSVAILARQIEDRVRCEDALLAHKFADCLVDAVLGAFFSYWREHPDRVASGYTPRRTAEAVDPIALCAIVGDLLSTRMLDFREFEDCVSTLLAFAPSALLLDSLYALFLHGAAHRHPAVTLPFLLRCIRSIVRNCALYRGDGFLEETKLTGLIYDIMFSTEDDFITDLVDERLDLDHALKGSVCSPLNEWMCDTSATKRSPKTPTSRSSPSTVPIPLVAELKIDPDLPHKRHHTDSPTSIITEKMKTASIEESLVLHMPRPISGVQWISFFREYS